MPPAGNSGEQPDSVGRPRVPRPRCAKRRHCASGSGCYDRVRGTARLNRALRSRGIPWSRRPCEPCVPVEDSKKRADVPTVGHRIRLPLVWRSLVHELRHRSTRRPPGCAAEGRSGLPRTQHSDRSPWSKNKFDRWARKAGSSARGHRQCHRFAP